MISLTNKNTCKCSEPEKNFLHHDSTFLLFVLSSHMISLTNKNAVLLFGLWNSSMGGFSDIGARQYFEETDLFMPELLQKIPWVLRIATLHNPDYLFFFLFF